MQLFQLSLSRAMPITTRPAAPVRRLGAPVCVSSITNKQSAQPAEAIKPLVNPVGQMSRRSTLTFSVAVLANLVSGVNQAQAYDAARVQVVKDMYAAFTKGDIAFILDQLDNKIKWTSMFNGTPYTWKGKDGVQTFFKEVLTNAEITKFQPIKFFTDDDGDEVATLVSVTLKGNENGLVESYDIVHVFTFDERGKVLAFYELSNTAAYARLIGNRAPKFI